jgi:hypothetical protein
MNVALVSPEIAHQLQQICRLKIEPVNILLSSAKPSSSNDHLRYSDEFGPYKDSDGGQE